MTDFTDKLTRAFPIIMRTGALRGGCVVPTGWESIVTDVSGRLEAYAAQHNPELIVDLVKSRFGVLRYHVSPFDEVADSMVREAEEASRMVCEVCGRPAAARSRVWVLPTCHEHS